MVALRIDNRTARALWLDSQGLAVPPIGPQDPLAVIRALGFVQLDTIQVVSRAHHHILWSRTQSYREGHLNPLLAKDRAVFEHFTHDASLLPMEALPHWTRQFRRLSDKFRKAGYYPHMPDEAGRAAIRDRIAAEGPLCSAAWDGTKKSKEMWARPPHKQALDYMWIRGELATSHREGFTKYYDLAERVFPQSLEALEGEGVSDTAQIDHLCRDALHRIVTGSLGDLQRFWGATSAAEVKAWAECAPDAMIPVKVQGADKSWRTQWAAPDVAARIDALRQPTARLRILNPFDPAIRDRDRLARLFDFHYRVEMFVPAAKRIWGYYVYPMLEGDRLMGRLEVKANRAEGVLTVSRLWTERGVCWTDARASKLQAELARFARLAEVEHVVWRGARPDQPEPSP